MREWGWACERREDGSLWAGFRFGALLGELLGDEAQVAPLASAVQRYAPNPAARWWFHPGRRRVTVAVGNDQYVQAS
jgi:hypothetical protein